jgi:hypothetical protein
VGNSLSRLFWRASGGLFRAVDAAYHRWHRLEPVGEVFFVGRERWRGPARRLADGTEIAPGDPLVSLHFNNQAIAAASGASDSAAASGLRFARRFFPACRALAAKLHDEPAWREVVAAHAIGWFPPHGERYGFEFERLPDGPRARWTRWYMLTLIMVANPDAGRRERRRLWPMEIWLSRRRLMESFLDRERRR